MSYITYNGLTTGPISHRTEEELALLHGFNSIEALSASLPADGEVIDIGAGFSRLGAAVTRLRTDITWINYDVAYSETWDDYIARHLAEARENAPNNLHFVAGNIVRPHEYFRQPRFSRIFSYYMLPHILYRNPVDALMAVRNMLQMGYPGTTLSIGPEDSFTGSKKALQVTIPSNENEFAAIAAEIVGIDDRIHP